VQVVFRLLKPLLKLLAILPFWALYSLSNTWYFFGYKVFRYRLTVVRQNLTRAFPELLHNEIMAVERAFYKHFFDLFAEGIKLSKISEADLNARCKVENTHLLNNYFEKNQSVIIVMGHIGNWEWASGAVNTQIKHQLQSLYQPIKNVEIDEFVKNIRTRFGTLLIERKNALRHLLAQPIETLACTVFLADQSPYQIEKAQWHTFFGSPTPFFGGYAALAIKLKTPIIFPSVKKISRGHYSISFETLVEDSENFSSEEIVQLYAKRLEKEIRNQPFNWLWTHKRWKRIHLKPSPVF